ncbi:27404_t:CDS:2, partial [Racocetra persica]
DVGNEPIVIYERSPGCINTFNRYVFTISNKCRSESLEVKEAYQQTYKLYEMYSHLEYPNMVIVKNDFGKKLPDFFTRELITAIENQKILNQLVKHTKTYK